MNIVGKHRAKLHYPDYLSNKPTHYYLDEQDKRVEYTLSLIEQVMAELCSAFLTACLSVFVLCCVEVPYPARGMEMIKLPEQL